MAAGQPRRTRQPEDDEQPRGQARGRQDRQDDADGESGPDDRARGRERPEGERDASKPGLSGAVDTTGAAVTGLVGAAQQAGDQAGLPSPVGVASAALGAALKETVTRLVNTLRELLQTVGGLLRTVVSLLRLVLVALREGVMAAVRPLGRGLGSVVGGAAGSVAP